MKNENISPNLHLKTSLANSGRSAGIGIVEDDYSENSCSKLGHYGVVKNQSPIFRNKDAEPKPEPVYTYNEKGEKILWEPTGGKTNDITCG